MIFKKEVIEGLAVQVKLDDSGTQFRVVLDDKDGTWPFDEQDVEDLVAALNAAQAQCRRLNAALVEPATTEAADGLELDVYLHAGTGAVSVVEPGRLIKSFGFKKVGTVSTQDWAHPEVREAYAKYGKHIGKRLKYTTGDLGQPILGFAFRGDREGAYIRYETGGWDRLRYFEDGQHEVVE